MKRINFKFILGTFFLFLAILFISSATWAIKNFKFTMEELIFYLNVPMKGANLDSVVDFCIQVLLPVSGVIIVFILLLKNPFKWKFNIKIKEKILEILPIKYSTKRYLVICITLFLLSLCVSLNKIGAFTYFNTQISSSNFIEENYIDPKNVDLYQKEKRNLIYIFVESMESTYFKKENGGDSNNNLLPNLTNLSKEYINFSNTSLIGGALSVPGVGWTVGGIVAQTAGIPLKIPIEKNSYGNFKTFLPGAYTLGDILKKEGYNQMFMMGSDATYGGRDSYLKSHGDYEIYDYYTALENGKFNDDYYVWWGYEDNKLFEYAKEEILKLAKKEEPFNFTLLTVDMHFPDGYLGKECETKFDENLSNVVACTDKKIANFIEWIKKQDFYEDTTIIISGDHTSMDGNYFNNVSDDYERTTYNLYINSCVTTNNYKNRSFSVMDLFPTTLASICFEIEGNKLALGTNLFSEEQTLIEKYGLSYVRDELAKRSPFFTEKIIYNK